MIPRRFPFQWGAVPSAAPAPPTPTPPVWTRLTAAGSWAAAGRAARTPRFEHVYAQVPGAERSQNLVYRVQSEFPFLIASANNVVIASTLSTP